MSRTRMFLFVLTCQFHLGSLNPARSFGPCVVLRSFPSYHWIYWVGPILGSLLSVAFYRFIKVLEYETVNPGQDFDEKEARVSHFDEENASTARDVERPNTVDLVSSRQSNQGQRDGVRSSDGTNLYLRRDQILGNNTNSVND